MKTRTLTRRVIIREYDFKRVKAEALSAGFATQYVLYDRAEFTPLNEDNLEKLKLVDILKGKKSVLSTTELNLQFPAMTLYQLRDYLYNEKYYNWDVTIDEDGFLCVQSRKNTPKSRLGWGVFEKDMMCRI
jgi:hypothetical protein